MSNSGVAAFLHKRLGSSDLKARLKTMFLLGQIHFFYPAFFTAMTSAPVTARLASGTQPNGSDTGVT